MHRNHLLSIHNPCPVVIQAFKTYCSISNSKSLDETDDDRIGNGVAKCDSQILYFRSLKV